MKTSRLLLVAGAAALAGLGPARAETVLTVQIALPALFKEVMEESGRRFMEAHPDITLDYRPPAENYPTAVTQRLREAITGATPDVGHHGLGDLRVLAERGLAVPLDDLIAGEPDWKKRGYTDSMTAAGRVGDSQVALPTCITNMVFFYNADLMRKAGREGGFPKSWDEIVRLGGAVDALGPDVSGGWIFLIPGDNWSWQTLVGSHGGRMMSEDERTVAFDGPAGETAMRILHEMATKGGLEDMTRAQATQAFLGGRLGFMLYSIAYLGNLERNVDGRFEVGTAGLSMPGDDPWIPAGGDAVVIFATDPEKQKAAWAYAKFMAGPESQARIASGTGCMPTNQVALDREDLLGGFYEEHPLFRPAIEQLPATGESYAFPDSNTKIADIMSTYMQQVVAGALGPDAALERMADDVRAQLPD